MITHTVCAPMRSVKGFDLPGGCLGCKDCPGICLEILELLSLPGVLLSKHKEGS